MGDGLEKVAQILAILAPASLSGFIICFSHAGVPTLNVAPIDVLLREFSVMYSIGKTTSPPIAMTAALCNGFLAHRSRNTHRRIVGAITPFALYSTAVLLVLAIIPYTLLAMEPRANKLLLDLGDQVNKGLNTEVLKPVEKDVRETLIVWKAMNARRALFVGIGALLTAIATILR
ncbi:DUF1772 family protein [Beauveria bassiana ARSEF 2860]|uniref:DUF1772 family protein n=1 Tax=Beauveria bassiana (strain ARSEF 2860) TaxID=655819 RepID=J4KPQ3_BEAB2|nr:DUF1772 family protein [Beauveria bassiana ARSEF 2860]EJP67854.1 DUF1772 family protein [Beauveria bassiana ARSEF 2860]